MISLGPRMGPSIPEIKADKPVESLRATLDSRMNDSPLAQLSSSATPPKANDARESRSTGSADRETKFSDVLRQQNPKVDAPKRAEIQESKRRDLENESPSDEIRPENDESVRSDVDAQGASRVKVASKGDRAGAVKGEKKEKAMLKFMDSMESEFGVPPVKIAEALANLKPTDLLKPPEETASQVIQNLELAPDDQSRAMQLYIGFLQQWNKAQSPDSTNFFVDSQARAVPGGMEQLMLAKTDRKQVLNDSLGQMQDKFFAKNLVEQAQVAPNRFEPGMAQALNRAMLSEPTLLRPAAGTNSLALEDGLVPLQSFGEEEIPLAELNPEAGSNEPGKLEIPMLERTPQKPMYAGLAQNMPHKLGRPHVMDNNQLDQLVYGEQNIEQPRALKPSEFFMTGQHAGQVAAAQGENPMIAQQMNVNRMADISPQDLTTAPLVAGMGAKSAGDRAEFGAKNSDDSQAQGDSSLNGKGSNIAGADFFQKPSALNGAGSLAAAATAGKAPSSDPNMQSIMNTAQIVVNRGGGEAIVKLNPEGLGEVRLKIMVVNGRVNVEMATQTKEAKQMIESSIGDLRSSLSTHKLAVDHVRVDVGNQAQSDSQQSHRGMDARPDMSRDQARSFFHQFREDTASRRDPFFEMPGIKAYQTRNPEPTPIPAASDRSAARFSGGGRGSRMNLVA